MRKVLFSVVALCFAALIMYSGWQIWQTNAAYENEAEMHKVVLQYRPVDNQIVNQGVIDLREKYPDVAGWLSIANTNIDYPFVWYADNEYYLHKNLDGKYAAAGTVFMDYRCNKDFTSQNTIIYGHHMKNKSMFGTLQSFNIKTFFEENQTGTIYLPHDTLTLEFFAYMVLNPAAENEIYSPTLSENYFADVKANARHYREIGVGEDDRIATLSTCAYEFNNARMVLLARIINNETRR